MPRKGEKLFWIALPRSVGHGARRVLSQVLRDFPGTFLSQCGLLWLCWKRMSSLRICNILRNMSCLRVTYEYKLYILQLYVNSLPTQSYSRPHREGENEEGDQPSQTGKENGGALPCERGKEGPCPLIIIACTFQKRKSIVWPFSNNT